MTARTITYSLRAGERTSARFYRELDAFADEVLAEAAFLRPVARALDEWADETFREAPRGEEEHLVELLALGVLWRRHGAAALSMPPLAGRTMERLYALRQGNRLLKPAADALRGVGATLHLAGSGEATESAPGLDDLRALCRWLAATGDLEQEGLRLALWLDFLAANPAHADLTLAGAAILARWFEHRSEAVLGRYTPEVERYLRETHPARRFREDYLSCGRGRVEYHLNMVGAAILNRAYRAAFEATGRKAVLAPSCLRARTHGCRAAVDEDDFRCTHCTPGCRVSALIRLGERHDFRVIVVSHASEFASWTKNPALRDGVGMVGVACVLNLLGGGWQAKAAGIPAQCVFLDHVGCRTHWDDEGIPTALDVDELLRLLGLPAAPLRLAPVADRIAA